MIRKVEFKNGKGLTLRGAIYTPQRWRTAIVFLHGFPGSSQGTLASAIPHAFPDCAILTFDFSGSDTSDGKFEDKLMSNEVADVKAAINFLEKNYPFKQLVLVGHSTGAIDASLYAHKDKWVDKLVLLGAVSDLKKAVHYDFSDMQVKSFWEKGYIIYNNPGKWVHHKKLKKAFYDEFFTLDIPKAIKKYRKPLLIIHGEKDDAVPVREAKELFSSANRPKRLVIIKDADHKFSHPKHFLKVRKLIQNFM